MSTSPDLQDFGALKLWDSEISPSIHSKSPEWKIGEILNEYFFRDLGLRRYENSSFIGFSLNTLQIP
jgi:hypothetical protein